MSSLLKPQRTGGGPQTAEDTGVRRSLLEDLALKIAYLEGEVGLRELGARMGLALPVVDDLFQRLRKAQLCEVVGMNGSVHRITPTQQGRSRAQELLLRNAYAGTAPVALDDYVEQVRRQSVRRMAVSESDVRRAFAPLVLPDVLIREIGVAVLSGTSLVLHGPTGTGKTAIAEHIPDIYSGDGVWLPHAIEVDGQIIALFDPHTHRRIEARADSGDPVAGDARWVYCERPRVFAGGELTIEMLDLQLSPASGYYSAPLQMKASNGILVIDDFGRQRISPEELLNRWIVPLDRHVDFLTLQGGKKFQVPFETLVVFSTNLDPASGFSASGRGGVIDQAFLRRIPNKIGVPYATPDEFGEIFRRVCAHSQVPWDRAAVDRLIEYLTTTLEEPLRPCYPRDLVQRVVWEARFEQRVPELSWEMTQRACDGYFLRGDAESPAAPRASNRMPS